MEKQHPSLILEPHLVACNREWLARKSGGQDINRLHLVAGDGQILDGLVDMPNFGEVRYERVAREAVFLIRPQYGGAALLECTAKSADCGEQAPDSDAAPGFRHRCVRALPSRIMLAPSAFQL